MWIVGSKGMLGSHFERMLERRNIPFVGEREQFVDITHSPSIEEFVNQHQVTHLINCAAYTLVDKAESETALASLVNGEGVANLGKIAKKKNLPLIHFSTDYVFDGLSQQPYEEDHPCRPVNAYGMTKWEGEVRLLQECPQACIIRTSWLFGYPGKNFVETILKLIQERETLKVVADQFGRPTYCEDLAEAALSLLKYSGVYHFANANQTSWYHFAQEIHHAAKALGLPLSLKTLEPISTVQYPTPAKRPAYSVLSTKKIEDVLPFKIRPWQEALKEYLVNCHCQQLACTTT